MLEVSSLPQQEGAPMPLTSKVRTLSSVLVAFVVMHAGVAGLRAQVAGANISGTVSDSAGRVLPNVQISVTNTATGVSR